MPQRDGTGPSGSGPGTGRGQGKCPQKSSSGCLGLVLIAIAGILMLYWKTHA